MTNKYRFEAGSYNGRLVGRGGFNHRYGVQIVAKDSDDRRRKVFIIRGEYRTYKSACLKLWEGVAHNKSGLNKKERAQFFASMRSAVDLADRLNKTQNVDLRLEDLEDLPF